MGERVTFRSRSRMDSLFPSPETSTVAAMEGNGYIGPFTPRQFTELWFRVKAIRVQASVSWSQDNDPDPPTTGTSEIDVTLLRVTSGGAVITSEIELVDDWASDQILRFKDENDNEFSTISSNRGQVIRDENGDIWFPGDLSSNLAVITSSDGVTSLYYGGDTQVPADNLHVFSSVTLSFSDSSTVPFPFFATAAATEITSATGSIEIVEWFPYADRAGLDAWDTTTGLQDNGGPGG